eukprot:SAG31_NODE_602_length_13638_cov_32.936037_4_plen_138_part_00
MRWFAIDLISVRRCCNLLPLASNRSFSVHLTSSTHIQAIPFDWLDGFPTHDDDEDQLSFEPGTTTQDLAGNRQDKGDVISNSGALKTLRLVRLGKLLRLIRALRLLKTYEDRLMPIFRTFLMVLFVVLICHLVREHF